MRLTCAYHPQRWNVRIRPLIGQNLPMWIASRGFVQNLLCNKPWIFNKGVHCTNHTNHTDHLKSRLLYIQTNWVPTTRMADPVGQAGTTHSRSYAPRVRLTCEACRQRKVKCDKSSPCASCQRLGLVCVPVERARLPRGRTRKPERVVGSDKELSERVARLEKLLKKVANEREDGLQVASTVPAPAYPYKQQQSAAESSNASPPNIRQDQNDNLPATGQPHLPRPSTAYVGGPFWEDIMQQVSLLDS